MVKRVASGIIIVLVVVNIIGIRMVLAAGRIYSAEEAVIFGILTQIIGLGIGILIGLLPVIEVSKRYKDLLHEYKKQFEDALDGWKKTMYREACLKGAILDTVDKGTSEAIFKKALENMEEVEDGYSGEGGEDS